MDCSLVLDAATQRYDGSCARDRRRFLSSFFFYRFFASTNCTTRIVLDFCYRNSLESFTNWLSLRKVRRILSLQSVANLQIWENEFSQMRMYFPFPLWLTILVSGDVLRFVKESKGFILYRIDPRLVDLDQEMNRKQSPQRFSFNKIRSN